MAISKDNAVNNALDLTPNEQEIYRQIEAHTDDYVSKHFSGLVDHHVDVPLTGHPVLEGVMIGHCRAIDKLIHTYRSLGWNRADRVINGGKWFLSLG